MTFFPILIVAFEIFESDLYISDHHVIDHKVAFLQAKFFAIKEQ